MAKKKKKIEDSTRDYLIDVYGKASVSEGENKYYSTGFLSLDKLLGGGWKQGSYVELYGPETSGKTSLCLHCIAYQQTKDTKCVYIDVERKFPRLAAEDAGIDLEKLLILTPPDGEVLFQMLSDILDKDVKFIVVDSVGAIAPRQVMEREYEDKEQAALPRLLSRNLKKLLPKLYEMGATIVFINQIREKVGITFGSNRTTPGGWAVKHYSSVRLSLRRGEKLKEGEAFIGNEIICTVDKNSFGPPLLKTTLTYLYNKGISSTLDLIKVALELNALQKNGSWFGYKDENLAQGQVNLMKLLEENKELSQEIEKEVRDKLKTWREFTGGK